jgi:hypothetical protein
MERYRFVNVVLSGHGVHGHVAVAVAVAVKAYDHVNDHVNVNEKHQPPRVPVALARPGAGCTSEDRAVRLTPQRYAARSHAPRALWRAHERASIALLLVRTEVELRRAAC